MLPERVKDILKAKVTGTLLWDEPMKKHTTFGIGGPADVLVSPRDESDLQQILSISHEYDTPVTIIGNGSNLLVADEGIDGIVATLSNRLNNISVQEDRLMAGAGCQLARLTRVAADAGLTGLEFAVGIPGTVGGAVVMNAGTREGSIADVVTTVRAISHDGQIVELDKKALEFGYRESILQRKSFIVVAVEMKLRPGDANEIEARMRSNQAWRKETQPIHLRTAGSIFKNPPGDYAGRLIEFSGCKGMSVGDAQVSDLHGNFIVNRGRATANDIRELMEMIVAQVSDKFGIQLEPEIQIVGRRA